MKSQPPTIFPLHFPNGLILPLFQIWRKDLRSLAVLRLYPTKPGPEGKKHWTSLSEEIIRRCSMTSRHRTVWYPFLRVKPQQSSQSDLNPDSAI